MVSSPLYSVNRVADSLLAGIQLCMFFLTNYFVIYHPSKRSSSFYIVYSAALLFLWTIALACNAIFGELVWIDHRDVPGGPAAYFDENISAWYNTLGTAAGVCLNFLGDALLVGPLSSRKDLGFLTFRGAISLLYDLGFQLDDHRLPQSSFLWCYVYEALPVSSNRFSEHISSDVYPPHMVQRSTCRQLLPRPIGFVRCSLCGPHN